MSGETLTTGIASLAEILAVFKRRETTDAAVLRCAGSGDSDGPGAG